MLQTNRIASAALALCVLATSVAPAAALDIPVEETVPNRSALTLMLPRLFAPGSELGEAMRRQKEDLSDAFDKGPVRASTALGIEALPFVEEPPAGPWQLEAFGPIAPIQGRGEPGLVIDIGGESLGIPLDAVPVPVKAPREASVVGSSARGVDRPAVRERASRRQELREERRRERRSEARRKAPSGKQTRKRIVRRTTPVAAPAPERSFLEGIFGSKVGATKAAPGKAQGDRKTSEARR